MPTCLFTNHKVCSDVSDSKRKKEKHDEYEYEYDDDPAYTSIRDRFP